MSVHVALLPYHFLAFHGELQVYGYMLIALCLFLKLMEMLHDMSFLRLSLLVIVQNREECNIVLWLTDML